MYLLSLPPQHLVDLLLMVESRYPDIPIYSPNTKKILGQRKGTPVLPLLSRPGTLTPVSGANTPNAVLKPHDSKLIVPTNELDVNIFGCS